MEKLIMLAFIITAFLSCTTLKKNVSKASAKVDSTGNKISAVTSVKKTDSSYAGTAIESVSNQTESAYTRTTTVKEYFGDEFSFENTLLPKDTNHSNSVFLRYRETTTTETGSITQTVAQRSKKEQTNNVHITDSTQQNQTEKYNVNKTINTKVTNRNSSKVLPGILVFIFFLLIIIFIYIIRKRITLWQILKQLLKL